MQLDRLLGILSILLQKDRVTAPELAEKSEVNLIAVKKGFLHQTAVYKQLITIRRKLAERDQKALLSKPFWTSFTALRCTALHP